MTASVARVNMPLDRRTAQRIPYAEASRVLLRDSILDGMRELLLTRDWSSITLSDVARAAGISRQTIYNEFGSRQGLAQGYALRLADRLVDAVDGRDPAATSAISTRRSRRASGRSSPSPHPTRWSSRCSPVVPNPTCCSSSPPTARPIITRCSERLTSTFMHSWVRASEEDAGVLARAIVRLCMSYVSMPPEADHDVARDLARLMTPFAERYGVIDTD